VGIRFKPFAFANLVAFSPQINNKTLPLNQLFELKKEEQALIQDILGSESFDQKVQHCEKLVLQILGDNLDVDQMFRAQLNYILDRKGLIEVRELFSEFGISKVTLRKHFLEKMGLSPKIVSRIWRLNHFLELKRASDCDSLTYLALESGYYDQAHFIREFKSFFHDSPKRFFKQESKLLSISQDIIANRFSNHYDPVFLVT
jgi:AraC-like DNA-binding protein